MKYYVSLPHVKQSISIGFGGLNNLYLLYRLSFRLFPGNSTPGWFLFIIN